MATFRIAINGLNQYFVQVIDGEQNQYLDINGAFNSLDEAKTALEGFKINYNNKILSQQRTEVYIDS